MQKKKNNNIIASILFILTFFAVFMVGMGKIAKDKVEKSALKIALLTLNGTAIDNINRLDEVLVNEEFLNDINRYVEVLSADDSFEAMYPGIDLNASGTSPHVDFEIVTSPNSFAWTLLPQTDGSSPGDTYDPETSSIIPENNYPGTDTYGDFSDMVDSVAFVLIEDRYYKCTNLRKIHVGGVKSLFSPFKLFVRFNITPTMSLVDASVGQWDTLFIGNKPIIIVTKDLSFENYQVYDLSQLLLSDTDAIAAIPVNESTPIITTDQKKSIYKTIKVNAGEIIIVPPYRHEDIYKLYGYYLGQDRLQNLIYGSSVTGIQDFANGTYLRINNPTDQFFEMGPIV